MAHLAAIFVAVCMVLITGSIGTVLYLFFGFSAAESSIVALAALTGLALYNTVSNRVRDRTDVSDQIDEMTRLSADLARQLAEVKRQFVAVEAKVDGAVNRARAAADPIAAEVEELGVMVKQLAETVAMHEAGRTPSPPAATIPDAAGIFAPAGAPETKSDKAAPGKFKNMDRSGILGLIRDAVAANRIDLFLQPIVTLPQRKVRYYEAMSRLRTEAGDQVMAADFLPYAESGGLMPKIDNLLLFRCVQVLRRLLMKNRDIGLFCNVSATTLNDPKFFPQFSEFIEANRALAPAMVFEFTQSAFRAMGPMQHESLAALATRGFRFSMDHVGDLRMDPRELFERGFRFVKVPASLLLNRNGHGLDVRPGEFADLLARSGIDLIAERIEGESSVVDLLDYDVKFGQGFLFSQPRAVRADALHGNSERIDIAGNHDGSPKRAQPEGALA